MLASIIRKLRPPGEAELSPPNEVLQSEDADLARRALENAEIAFAKALTEDEGGAIVTWASNDIRVFRENAFPVVGKTAAKLMLNSDTAKMMRASSGGGDECLGRSRLPIRCVFSRSNERDRARLFSIDLESRT